MARLLKNQEPQDRITPDAFKREARRRGWTFRALALRWEKSETWVSKIANNPDRGMVWDDAVLGLPTINRKDSGNHSSDNPSPLIPAALRLPDDGLLCKPSAGSPSGSKP